MKFFAFVLNLFLLINLVSWGSVQAEDAYTDLLSHDGFFRASGFKKIEKICFQLHDDLDILSHGVLPELLEQSGYLLKQFCCLFTSVQELAGNQEESRMFLPDDISYLLTLFEKLEKKLNEIEVTIQQENQLFVCIKVLLEQGKQKLQMLVEHNIEVLFDVTMLEQYLVQC